MIQPLWKTAWQLLKKLKIDLPYDLEILLLGIYPREMKTYVHEKISHTEMFIAPLFIIIEKVEITQVSINSHIAK